MLRDENGILFFRMSDREDAVDLCKELLRTPTGQTYKEDCFTTEEADSDVDRITQACSILFGTVDDISVQQAEAALKSLMKSGRIPKRNQEEPAVVTLASPAVDSTPRDKAGRPLSQNQIDWGEMTRFANASSADAIRQRKNVDPKFRQFLVTNLKREMSHEVGDAATDLNANRVPQKSGVPQDVWAFAQKYPRLSTEELKRILSPAQNPDGPAAAREAQRLFDAACADSLI